MLYICIFSNKFDLKQTIRVLHISDDHKGSLYCKCFMPKPEPMDIRHPTYCDEAEDR